MYSIILSALIIIVKIVLLGFLIGLSIISSMIFYGIINNIIMTILYKIYGTNKFYNIVALFIIVLNGVTVFTLIIFFTYKLFM